MHLAIETEDEDLAALNAFHLRLYLVKRLNV